MNSILSKTFRFATASSLLFFLLMSVAHSQTPAQAHRLILKDGTYQAVTKYEVQGERVRYFSAERGEWEDVPNALIDWDATKKFEQGSALGPAAPEAAALDKQIDSDRKAEMARSPQVAPGLRLPDGGGIFLLDTYENQPQLTELQQSAGEMEENTKSNAVRAAINPLGGIKQTIELPGPHAKVQSHTAVPSVYINMDVNGDVTGIAPVTAQVGDDGAASSPSPPPLIERYKIIRVESKAGKRVAGAVKIAITGKMKTDERYVSATATAMTGGWVKLTPTDPLPTGEYAVAELLGKDGMNLYVWDFGVNPSAPANATAWKPESPDAPQKTNEPVLLQKR
jgi:hypothetical protein